MQDTHKEKCTQLVLAVKDRFRRYNNPACCSDVERIHTALCRDQKITIKDIDYLNKLLMDPLPRLLNRAYMFGAWYDYKSKHTEIYSLLTHKTVKKPRPLKTTPVIR